jgi:hypothetical protein
VHVFADVFANPGTAVDQLDMYCLTYVLPPVLPLQVPGRCPGPVGVICRGSWGQGASHLPPALHHAGELRVSGCLASAAAWDLRGEFVPVQQAVRCT